MKFFKLFGGSKTQSVYKLTLPILAIPVGLAFSTITLAANQSRNCMHLKHYTTSPSNPHSVLRNQFTAMGLLGLSQKLMHDYFEGGSQCMITLPVWSWTGVDPIPTTVNLPTETIAVKSLTQNQLAERLLTLSALMVYELEPEGRTGVLSNDIADIDAFPKGNEKYTKGMQTLLQQLYAKKVAGEVTLEEARSIALLLGISYFDTLTKAYTNPNVAFENNFPQLYSTTTHKFYNQLQSSDVTYGLLSAGNLFAQNWAFLNFIPPDELGLTEANIKTLPQALSFDAKKLKKMLAWEKEGVGRYFWPRAFADVPNSRLYTFNGVDPDGYSRPADVTTVNFNTPGNVMTWDFLDQYAVDFTSLRVDSPAGANCMISFAGCPDFETFGLQDLITLNTSPNVANKVIQYSAKIWNKKIAPIYAEFSKIAAIRRAESNDDFYQGAWRAKIKHVSKVNRDANGIVTSIVANGMTVPLNGSLSSNKKIRAIQEAVAEMDRWFNENLENAQNLHTGDTFNLLYKVDNSFGLCGGTTGTTPYPSLQAILDNYLSQTRTVNGDAQSQLADLVFNNGFAVSQFLYDIKEFIADSYVKENFATYGFADSTTAGLCKQNPQGHLVTYDEVKHDIQAKQNGSFATSDVSVLGRHYGYESNGDRRESEWSSPTQLKYTYQPFDFIYRQHYAVDNTQPLTPDNITDPQTGKILYQYTDPGDEARRSAFIDTFRTLETTSPGQVNSGKLGSYHRWKIDWVFQKLSGFVISNAVQKKIIPSDFNQSYFATTFVDSNDNNNLCGFNLVKSAPETIRFRIIGTLGGSANSSSIPNVETKDLMIRVAFPTVDPVNLPTVQNNVDILLHEGSLGHGFDNVPNFIDLFRGEPGQISWLSNMNNLFGFTTEGGWFTSAMVGPGAGTLFEGWATYGEVQGVLKKLVVKFNANGCPILDDIDNVSAFLGMVDLSRIGARQVVAVAENYSKYAWSFYHSIEEFTRLSDIPVINGTDYHMRFIGHPTQQTEYASGLVTNLGILGLITAEANARGCERNEAAYNQFRITRTDYILGATLEKVVRDNIDLFLTCP